MAQLPAYGTLRENCRSDDEYRQLCIYRKRGLTAFEAWQKRWLNVLANELNIPRSLICRSEDDS